MNQLNRKMAPDIETMYLMASPQYSFLSSSGVKELAMFGGDLTGLVPAAGGHPFAGSFEALRTEVPAMDVLVLIDKLDDTSTTPSPSR